MSEQLMIKFPAAVQYVYEFLQEQFGDVVFTGSRAIGCERGGSDWDFVVSGGTDDVMKLSNLRVTQQLNNSRACIVFVNVDVNMYSQRTDGMRKDYFRAVRFWLNGSNLNVIIDHRGPQVLDKWRVATDYCAENQVFDKDIRIAVFEDFGAG